MPKPIGLKVYLREKNIPQQGFKKLSSSPSTFTMINQFQASSVIPWAPSERLSPIVNWDAFCLIRAILQSAAPPVRDNGRPHGNNELEMCSWNSI